jgi:hypothetical protein
VRILFIGEGRLGNQIFQYAALSSLADAGARITAFGLEDLGKLFELRGPALQVVRGGIWLKRFAKYLLAPLVLRPLSRWLRLFSYAWEPEEGDLHRGAGGRLRVQRGLLGSLLFVDGGYYQNGEYWGEVFPPRWLELRSEWRERAQEVVASLSGSNSRPVFLHVRRGDYAGFSTHGVDDLLLPTEYFRRAIRELMALGDVGVLLLVTDDPAWAKQEFSDVGSAVIVSFDPCTDFALMACCGGGIVSNSTFSLAAALFMREPRLVIAPEFWFGFRVRQWLPPKIRFEHPRFAYLEVLPREAA